jgi:hypothetical protein
MVQQLLALGPEGVVHDDDVVGAEHAHPDRLVGAGGERVGPDHRAGAQFVRLQIGVAQLQ